MIIYLFSVFFCGIWVFSSNRKHLLVTLLRLEFIVLLVYMCTYLYINTYSYELFFGMVFLIFSVCEGALGLSILVSIIRSCGNDYFYGYNILQC